MDPGSCHSKLIRYPLETSHSFTVDISTDTSSHHLILSPSPMSNLASWASSWASGSLSNEDLPETGRGQDLIDDTQITLFDAIDRLGKLAVASDIEYPQLVVVGDQSCGKSSVLEAIGRFHFPVSDRLWYVTKCLAPWSSLPRLPNLPYV